MDLKPIETIYNGYKFRSRLEARWAVFFDTVGIKYEYEPEGYVLGDGVTYLPDFKLLNVKHRDYEDENKPVFVEVKGVMTNEDLIKIEKFSKTYPILIIGTIEDAEEQFEWWKGSYRWSFNYMDGDSYPCMFTGKVGEIWLAGPDHDEWFGLEIMRKGIKAAKQARFEHGEKG